MNSQALLWVVVGFSIANGLAGFVLLKKPEQRAAWLVGDLLMGILALLVLFGSSISEPARTVATAALGLVIVIAAVFNHRVRRSLRKA